MNNQPQKNKFLLNIIKTEVVIFGTGPFANICVKIRQHQLKRVMEYKYLGVVLDNGLTWKTHVGYISAKVGKWLGLLRRIREDLGRLEHLQNRAARIVLRNDQNFDGSLQKAYC